MLYSETLKVTVSALVVVSAANASGIPTNVSNTNDTDINGIPTNVSNTNDTNINADFNNDTVGYDITEKELTEMWATDGLFFHGFGELYKKQVENDQAFTVDNDCGPTCGAHAYAVKGLPLVLYPLNPKIKSQPTEMEQFLSSPNITDFAYNTFGMGLMQKAQPETEFFQHFKGMSPSDAATLNRIYCNDYDYLKQDFRASDAFANNYTIDLYGADVGTTGCPENDEVCHFIAAGGGKLWTNFKYEYKNNSNCNNDSNITDGLCTEQCTTADVCPIDMDVNDYFNSYLNVTKLNETFKGNLTDDTVQIFANFGCRFNASVPSDWEKVIQLQKMLLSSEFRQSLPNPWNEYSFYYPIESASRKKADQIYNDNIVGIYYLEIPILNMTRISESARQMQQFYNEKNPNKTVALYKCTGHGLDLSNYTGNDADAGELIGPYGCSRV